MVIVRFWLFYYQSQLNRIYQNSSWRMAIDSSNESNNNWFVKNNKYLGNKKFLFNLCCITGAVAFGLFMVITNLPNVFGGSQFIGDIVIFIIVGGCIIIGGYIVIKLKYNTLDDSLGIRREIFFLLKCLPWPLMVGLLIPQILILCHVGNEWVKFVRYIGFCLVATVLCYVTVLYPKKLQKIDHDQKSENKNKNENDKIRMNRSDRITSESMIEQHALTWKNVVCYYDGFEAFINHLATEFSTENLLFIQEVE